jgi:hypothetical protein
MARYTLTPVYGGCYGRVNPCLTQPQELLNLELPGLGARLLGYCY